MEINYEKIKSFQIIDNTVTIGKSDELMRNTGHIGESDAYTNKITMQEPYEKANINGEYASVWWHEFIHLAFDKIGRYDLSKDEALVSLLGRCINQCLNTIEFNENTDV